MVDLLDVVETWAATKGWWSWKSERGDVTNGKRFINISIKSRPPFSDLDYVTLYEDGLLCPWSPEELDFVLVPADPNFFDKLELLLSKSHDKRHLL